MPCPQREHRGEPRSTGDIIPFASEQFVEPPLRQPAIKCGVQRSMPARKAPIAQAALRSDNSGNTPPQHSEMIERLSHSLFLICSNYAERQLHVKRGGMAWNHRHRTIG